MSVPTNRAEFSAYILRKIGAPVLEINVDDLQVDDRIDEALNYWNTFHCEATEKVYYKYLVTSDDIANKYITLPDNIIGAVRTFDLGIYMGVDNMFNIRYQIALNDLYTLTSQSMVPYFMAMQQMSEIQELLVGHQPIRFNRHNHKLYLDTSWVARIQPGQYLVVEAYQVLDPTTATDLWNDIWLQRYAAALVKKSWGENLSKFVGMTLPGGIQFNGEKIKQEAQYEIEKLEKEMRDTWSGPLEMFIG